VVAIVPAPTTKIIVKPGAKGQISPGLFGANLMWAYSEEGAFNQAANQFYPSFVAELRSLGVTSVRYPGGTTSDSFFWERAIGPQNTRQDNEPYGMQASTLSSYCCDLDSPTRSVVGPDQFGVLLSQIGATGDIVVNFATGTVQQAADFVAYMTAPAAKHPSSSPASPSYWAALRVRNGHPAPYSVPYWEIGNEQYFPGQYGWRSGKVVKIAPSGAPCPAGQTKVCLYAFGGNTAFSDQTVGTFADEQPAASYSAGTPNQTFYVYFPPIIPSSVTVQVAGRRWTEVAHLAAAQPQADVYQLNPATGAIAFGNGTHGRIPPAGTKITVSYQSGPHGGFVQFYRAMKKMNPAIHVCESEEQNVAFLQIMGTQHPYNCVQLHSYADPRDVNAPMLQYEQSLMAAPAAQGATVGQLQTEIRYYSHRNIPVIITEYGQLVAPMPKHDPDFNLSLDESLLVGTQLQQWILHRIPLAEKYLLDSAPFSARPPVGLSVDSAMVAGPGPVFVAEPTGEVLALASRLARAQLLHSYTVHNPAFGAQTSPDLTVTAASAPSKQLELLVTNSNSLRPVRTRVVLTGLCHGDWLQVSVLDGPSPTAYNTRAHPDLVTLANSTFRLGKGNFDWTFPAHSVTLLQISPNPTVSSSSGTVLAAGMHSGKTA